MSLVFITKAIDASLIFITKAFDTLVLVISDTYLLKVENDPNVYTY